ncbi:MAG: DUF3329 domain-containing protein, partial [Methyloprofundus sp.]|nr:DUF3329 domain-containing protein [Methyloprofundus sp.]
MSFWHKDLFHYTVAIFCAFIASLFMGHFLYFLLAICITIIIRQTYLLKQLEHWLSAGAKANNPTHDGLWEEIYYHIFRIKKANKKRKKQLSTIIEQFRKSTAALPDAVVVLGEYDEISWFNEAAKKILGLQKSDKGQRIPNLIRTPAFVDFLIKKDSNAVLSINSPINKNITL